MGEGCSDVLVLVQNGLIKREGAKCILHETVHKDCQHFFFLVLESFDWSSRHSSACLWCCSKHQNLCVQGRFHGMRGPGVIDVHDSDAEHGGYSGVCCAMKCGR